MSSDANVTERDWARHAGRAVTTQDRKGTGHVSGFDGTRGVAALVVVIHHTIFLPIDLAAVAVFVFFVLSGFLITNILRNERLKMEQGRSVFRSSLKNFWTRRALRIFPAYYMALALTILVDRYLLGGHFYREALWYLTYLQNFFIALVSHSWGIFTHTWSLAVEQQFYIVLAPLLLAIPASRHAAVVLLLFALCVGIMFGAWFLGAGEGLLYLLPFTGIGFALGGGFIALNRERLPAFLGQHWLGALSLAAMPVLAVHALPLDIPYKYALLMLAASGFIAYVVERPDSPVVRLLETRPLVFLGNISYSLYIIHYPLRVLLGERLPKALVENAFIFLPLVVCASVLLAAASYYLVEKKFLAMKRYFA